MILVHASSTPNTIRVRSRSEMGILSRKWRTKLRISARLPGWLENSSFRFLISDRITLARVNIASSFDHRKIHAEESTGEDVATEFWRTRGARTWLQCSGQRTR